MPSTNASRPYRIRFFKDRLKFSSAHFTMFGDGACERLHGHNYRVSVETDVQELERGLACPFHHLKRLVEDVIRPLDEMVLIPANSDWVHSKREGQQIHVDVKTPLVEKSYVFPADEVFLLRGENISSECLAEFLFKELEASFKTNDIPVGVRQVCVMESNGQEVCYTATP